MHKTKSRAFTLIELIIVIAIIAILAVTAFLVLTKWMGKSRDSRRVNDISAINSALQIYISDASLIPLPDSYSGVYDTGYALAWYQGNFTDNIASQLSNISKNIKDPQSGYYGYSVTFDRKQYQVRALTENTVGYQNNITKQVYAASQTAKMQGNYAGFLVTYTGSLHSLWNVPSLFLFSGTAITSGTQFTGGNNNFLQDNKTTDNIYPLAIVDVSNLYNSSTSDDSAVYTNIINAYSGTNNVISQSGATAVVQSAAGGMVNNNVSQVGCPTNITQDSYTKLFLNFDNNVIDSSSNNYNVTNNGVIFNNSIYKFGGYGSYFNGSTYLSLVDNSNWDLLNSNFTIDWREYNDITPTAASIYARTDSRYPGIIIQLNSGNKSVHFGSNGTSFDIGALSFGVIVPQTWYYRAVVRNGNVFTAYSNGIQTDSFTSSSSIFSTSGTPLIGRGQGGFYFKGYLENFRISKGIARRTSNFTPPSCPY